MIRLKLCTILALLGLLLVDRTARADAAADAEKLKKDGFSRLAAGDYANGITAMEKAYTLVPAPGYLLNIAIAYDLWSGHCAEARKAFDRFFESCSATQCAEKKTGEERSARLRDKCEVLVSARTNPSGAIIAIDGVDAGRAPIELKVGPGTHELTATLDGHAKHAETLTVVEGRPQSLSISLRPAEAPKVVEPPPPPPKLEAALVAPPVAEVKASPEEESSVLSSPVFWIVTAAVVVAGGVTLGIVLGSGPPDPSGGSLGRVFGGE